MKKVVKVLVSAEVGVDSLASKWERTTKKEYVETALGMEAEVFIFETERELVTWLKS